MQEDMIDTQVFKEVQQGTAHVIRPSRPGTLAPPPGFAGLAKASFKAADTARGLHSHYQVCAWSLTLLMH